MKGKEKAFVFDLDGTLFSTSAEILGSPSSPDYIEFGDAEKLLEESKPLPLIAFAAQVSKEGHKVYILTARKNVIAKAIKTLLAKYDIEAEYVFCVGDKGFNVPTYKAEILTLLSEQYKTYFWDDEEPNLILAEKTGVSAYKA